MTHPPQRRETVEYDAEDDIYRTSFQAGQLPPSAAIVDAIAELTGREPGELIPLYESVDADALDALVRSTLSAEHRGDTQVSFRYHGYDITVQSYGVVTLDAVEAV